MPGVFETGKFEKAGVKEIDELAEELISGPSALRSPEYIGDLERIIGPGNRKALGRQVVLKASGVEEYTTKEGAQVFVINPDAMEAALGLGREAAELGLSKKGGKETIARLLNGTGTSVGDLKHFIDAYRQFQKTALADPSVYMTRRIVLSGNVTVPRFGRGRPPAAEGVLGIAQKTVDVGSYIIGGRLFVKLLSTPGGLRVLTEGVKMKPTTASATMAAARIGRMFPKEDVTVSEEEQ